MLPLKSLEYLEAIYTHKNFTKAAEALYVSQPAISASIRKLEEDLGLKLIIRTPKKVIFTEDGERLITQVHPLLQELRLIEAEMIAKSKIRKSVLNLGLSPTAPPEVVHRIYKNFLPSLNDNEEVLFDEGGAYYHIEKIARGDLDVAINVIPEDLSQFPVKGIPIYRQEIRLVMRADNELAKYEKIPFQMLSSARITSLGEASYLPRRLESEAVKRNIRLNIASKHILQTSYIEEILLGDSCGIINVDNLNTPRALYNYKQLVLRPFLDPMYLDMGIMFPDEAILPHLTKKIIDFVTTIPKQHSTF